MACVAPPQLRASYLCKTMSETVLVLGASDNPSRYSYIATHMLLDYGHRPVLVGKRPGTVRDIQIMPSLPEGLTGVNTVTLYLNPLHQQQWMDEIIALKPKRVIFNPGTENPEFEDLLEQQGIEAQIACTLVLLRTGQY